MEAFVRLVSWHEIETLARILSATALGAVIGYEREKAGKIAGLRTHTLVAMGAALFTVVSILLYRTFPSINGVTGYDYHIVANIIVGIGFIGAGAILRNGDRVSGTTTAATLWISAAIGTAAGFGFYREAVATTVLVYGVLTLVWAWEKRLRNAIQYQVIPSNGNGNGNGHDAAL